ncbi:MAG: hypothetical protein ACKVOR_05355 [Flavobacteriales bacterium]
METLSILLQVPPPPSPDPYTIVIWLLAVFIVAPIILAVVAHYTADVGQPTGTIVIDAGPGEAEFELRSDMTCEQLQQAKARIEALLQEAKNEQQARQTDYDDAANRTSIARTAVYIASAAVAATAWWNPIALAIAATAFLVASGILSWYLSQESEASVLLTQANNNVTQREQQLGIAQAMTDVACSAKKDTPIRVIPTYPVSRGKKK